MHNIAVLFIIMPYIGYGGMPSDVQPFALIFAFIASISILANKACIRASWPLGGLLFILMCALVSAVATLAFGGLAAEGGGLIIARALYGYLTPVVIFIYISLVLSQGVRVNWVGICDLVIVVTAFGFLMNVAGLTDIIKIFVSRAGFEGGLNANRGLTSFYPEQSRVSVQMLYLAIIYLWQRQLTVIRALSLLTCGLLSFAGQFFINVLVVALAGMVGSLVRSVKTRSVKISVLLLQFFGLLIGCSIVYAAINNTDYLISLGLPSRGIRAIANIFESGSSYMGTDHGFLFKVSGLVQGLAILQIDPFRFQVSTSAFFLYDSRLFDLYREFMVFWFDAEYYPVPIKSFSVFGSYVSDFGFIGLLSLLVLVGVPVKKLLVCRDGYSCSFVAFSLVVMCFLLLVRSNTSDPTFWALWAVLVYGVNIVTHKTVGVAR